MPEDVIEARKEVAAGSEGAITDFGYYYLAQKIDGLGDKIEAQRNFFENKLDTKIDSVRQEVNSLRQEFDNKLETKIDGLKHELKAEIRNVQNSLKAEIGSIHGSLKTEIGSVQSGLKAEITEQLRQEMYSFRLWSIGTFVAVLIGALSLVISALQ